MRCVITAFLVGSLLAGRAGADPPPLHPNPSPALPDVEAFHRTHLESNRRHAARLKDTIELYEKQLADFSDLLKPEQTAWLRERIQAHREELRKQERWVQELERYEQQRNQKPGAAAGAQAFARLMELRRELWPPPAVAPMPREKK